jgi:xanthine dehydrogenase accessory factor
MIGSKKRVRTVLDGVLGTDGRPEDLARVYAPIGLDIGSQSPEEIAVAIGAELVKVRRGGKAASLRLGVRPYA